MLSGSSRHSYGVALQRLEVSNPERILDRLCALVMRGSSYKWMSVNTQKQTVPWARMKTDRGCVGGGGRSEKKIGTHVRVRQSQECKGRVHYTLTLNKPHSLDTIPFIQRKPMIHSRWHHKQVARCNVHGNSLLVWAVVLAQVEESRAFEDVADFFIFVHVPGKDERQY